jgi:hypothetical protein
VAAAEPDVGVDTALAEGGGWGVVESGTAVGDELGAALDANFSAAASSHIDWKRICGSRASARVTTSSSTSLTSGRSDRTGGGVPCAISCRSASRFSATNGRRPASIS